MAITIGGIKLNTVDIVKNKENGQLEITGSYSLVSNTDVVLATQSFNGYGNIKVEMSKETNDALQKFHKGVKDDLESILGLRGG